MAGSVLEESCILLARVSSKENQISLTLWEQELAFCCSQKFQKFFVNLWSSFYLH